MLSRFTVFMFYCVQLLRDFHTCKTTKTVSEINNKQIHGNLHNSTDKESPKLKAEQIGIEAGSDTTCKHNI
jgi:hypothetical protein